MNDHSPSQLAPSCFRRRLELTTLTQCGAPFAWTRTADIIAVHDPAGSLLDAVGIVARLRTEAGLTARDRVLYRDGSQRWDEILHDGKYYVGVLILRGRTLADALAIAAAAEPREPATQQVSHG